MKEKWRRLTGFHPHRLGNGIVVRNASDCNNNGFALGAIYDASARLDSTIGSHGVISTSQSLLFEPLDELVLYIFGVVIENFFGAEVFAIVEILWTRRRHNFRSRSHGELDCAGSDA